MKEIELTQGKVALVDDIDFEWLNQWKWLAQKNKTVWYARRHVGAGSARRTVLMHNQILGVLGVDHIDHDGLNNCRSNLRAATQSQNRANSRGRSDNKSGFKGVSWNQARRKWQAFIGVEGRQIWLGYHKTKELAAAAYNEAAREHYGEFACHNLVDIH